MDTSAFILSCSGPGTWVAIRQSITTGYVCAALGGVATLALAYNSVRTRRVGFALPVAGLLMAFHPAWTVSATYGDCGASKRETSYFVTAIFIGLLIFQLMVLWRAAGKRRQRD